MLNKIIDQLNKQKLSAWQIREIRQRSSQSFLAKEDRECERVVETLRYDIAIHHLHDDKKLGMAEFTVVPETLPRLEKSLEEALFMASLVKNQPFDLPEKPATLPTVDLCDDQLGPEILANLEDRLKNAVDHEKGIRLAAAEFFVTVSESRLINHRGLDLQQKDSVIEAEIILLSKSDTRENEFIERTKRRRESEFKLEDLISRSSQFARDATHAGLPKTGAFPVVLSEEPLDQIFSPFVARASARVKYNRLLDVQLGKNVMGEKESTGEPLTLWSNPLVPGAMGSYRFDSYGTPGQRVCLIESNKVKTLLADKRYADYLNLPPTGELGCIEVQTGRNSFQTLLSPSASKPIYHIQAFSAFEPNTITGAFSAEIRAGYEISTSGIRPIKGGSVSGVIQKDLINAVYSKEHVLRERYLGPQAIHFKQLTLSGE